MGLKAIERDKNDGSLDVPLPPPLVYIPLLVAGLMLHFLWKPLGSFPEGWIGHAIGWPVTLVSGFIFIWAARTMFRSGEHPDFGKPTRGIITSGPFGFSRNPLYFSLTLLYVGIALIANSIWPFVFLPVALFYVHYGVIAREEIYLEKLFNDEYRRYRTKVRRWL